MTEERLQQIATTYGTPTFVFDIDEVVSRVNKIRELLNGQIGLVYSIKANTFLAEKLAQFVDYLEVCSPGELEICKAQGIGGNKILYSGVNKECEDIKAAMEHKAAIYTAESLSQLEKLNYVGGELGMCVPILLRLTVGTQFGMSEEDIEKACSAEYEHVEIIGLHYFAGTQRKRLKEQEAELEYLLEFIDHLESTYDVKLRHLEYGPGLPFPYFDNEDFSDTLAPLKALLPALQRVAERIPLTIEMGRFIVSSCGYYLTRVADIKHNGDAHYAIVDGGMNHLTYLGQMMGMKNPLMYHLHQLGTLDVTVEHQSLDWTVCGSLCTTADVILRKKTFTNLAIGDILAFCNCGAYTVTEGIYLFLSRTMPRIVFTYEDGHSECVRDWTESYPLNMRQ